MGETRHGPRLDTIRAKLRKTKAKRKGKTALPCPRSTR